MVVTRESSKRDSRHLGLALEITALSSRRSMWNDLVMQAHGLLQLRTVVHIHPLTLGPQPTSFVLVFVLGNFHGVYRTPSSSSSHTWARCQDKSRTPETGEAAGGWRGVNSLLGVPSHLLVYNKHLTRIVNYHECVGDSDPSWRGPASAIELRPQGLVNFGKRYAAVDGVRASAPGLDCFPGDEVISPAQDFSILEVECASREARAIPDRANGTDEKSHEVYCRRSRREEKALAESHVTGVAHRLTNVLARPKTTRLRNDERSAAV
nr:unnamed protein product [Spirometra erinaceieuropaei]